MKKVLICICSYNTKQYTKRIYEEISCSDAIDVMIIDNSSEEKEIPDFGICHHIGYDNVEFGGMHDYILNLSLIWEYKFVGIFNNDIFGFTSDHFQILQKYLNDDSGYISFSVSPEYDKSAGVMYTGEQKTFREVNFIENIAPIYNIKLLGELKKYSPVNKYGLIDWFMSKKSIKMGMKNIIIDEVFFHHMRSGTRKKTGSFGRYLSQHKVAKREWIKRFPEIEKMVGP